MPQKSTLRIISIVRARVDALLKEIFDMSESSGGSSTAKSLSDTIATEIAIYDTVETVIRRLRNERTLFSRLSTDIVHSIFGIVLDVDRIHDPDLPSDTLKHYWNQLERMRLVSSAWNNFLLSSPRYWQAIDVTRPNKAITSAIERSGRAPLCIYSFAETKETESICLVPAARVQTLRSTEEQAYHLYRRFLQNPMPALQTLDLRAPRWMRDDPNGPLGNLPSIRHLKAYWWQPPADAAWLTGLKELDMECHSKHNTELLQILSACANLEQLYFHSMCRSVVGEPSGATSPITLPRLRSIILTFDSNELMVELTRRLVAPQCLRRILRVDEARDLGLYLADYRRFMSGGERYPESAAVLINGRSSSWDGTTELDYKTKSCRVSFMVRSEEEVPAFHDLVQELQTLYNGPRLTATVRSPSEETWLWLKSLGDQNVQTIVTYLAQNKTLDAGDLVKAIAARPADLPSLDGPVANSDTGWPFKSLRFIKIHDVWSVNLAEFIGLVGEYLDKDSRPLLKNIVFVDCNFKGMEWDHAVERLEEIGITLGRRFINKVKAS